MSALLLWLALGVPPAVLAQGAGGDVCIADAASPHISLASCGSLLVDPGGRLGIDDASSPAMARDFRKIRAFRSGGYTSDVHWYHFTVRRNIDAPGKWILEIGAAFLDDVRVYVPNVPEGAHAYRETRLGDHVPRDQVPVRSRMHTMELALPAGAPLDVYVRVESRSALLFNAELWQVPAFFIGESRANFIQSLYFGALGLVVVLYAVLGVVLREKSLVFYALYVATMVQYYLSINGFFAFVLTPEQPWIQDYFTESAVLGMNLAIVLMWKSFADVNTNFPRLRRLYQWVVGIIGLCLLAVGTSYYGVASQISTYLTIAFTLFSLILLIMLMRRAWDTIVFLYVLAFLPPLAGGVVQMAIAAGIIEQRSWFFPYLYQLTSLTHVTLLSVSFIFRIRKIQARRRQAEQDAILSTRLADEQRKVVAMLSHEFRSPLAAIDRAAEMVEINTPALGEKARERIGRIRRHTRRMAGLVDVFLTAEALEHGKLALRAEPTDAGAIIDRLRTRFDEESAAGRLVIEAPCASCRLDADLELLDVALGNVVENALRYSPKDSRVTLSAAATGSSLSVDVADRGKGMSADEIAKIGALYFRGKSSSGLEGSGLGLYIARRIVDAHGGRIEVASRPGEGSRFTVILPATAMPAPA